MDFLRVIAAVLTLTLLTGCQITYYWKQARGHLGLLSDRQPITDALNDPRLSESDKNKIKLAEKARHFAYEKLGLIKTDNYSRFVLLDRPYVTYTVNAAPKWQLKNYTWDFLFVGQVPYKGFYSEAEAKQEEQLLANENLDTYVRGISAYSTLGWFEDPLLSSMLKYKEHDLVNTIIHETVHATLFIKNSADFNEQLATFVGNKGTEIFYLQLEGEQSSTLKKIKDENHDEQLFSDFITQELSALDSWYKSNPPQEEGARQLRIAQIQTKFRKEVFPRLKSDQYKKFPELKLNNARLMLYRTYMKDLSIFEKLYTKLGSDMPAFMAAVKKLEKHQNPEQGLVELAH